MFYLMFIILIIGVLGLINYRLKLGKTKLDWLIIFLICLMPVFSLIFVLEIKVMCLILFGILLSKTLDFWR